MSTLDTQTTARAHADSRTRASRLTLASLAETLAGLDRRPELPEVNEWMREVEITADELRPHVGFKEGAYARHRVYLCEHAELLVLCWRPGQRTPIHDHNGSIGAVRVLQGAMWGTLFEMDEASRLAYKSSRPWPPGRAPGPNFPLIHLLCKPDVRGQVFI